MAKRKTRATPRASARRKSGTLKARARKSTARARKASAHRQRPSRKPASRRRSAARRRVSARTKRVAARTKSATPRPRARAPRPTSSGAARRGPAPGLQRPRRILEDNIPTPPSSLDLDRHASAANSGRAEILEALRAPPKAVRPLTGGDVDADWARAYDSGDEAPGGDNPHPTMTSSMKSAGLWESSTMMWKSLKGADKVNQRDRHRWELDPRVSEDYPIEEGRRIEMSTKNQHCIRFSIPIAHSHPSSPPLPHLQHPRHDFLNRQRRRIDAVASAAMVSGDAERVVDLSRPGFSSLATLVERPFTAARGEPDRSPADGPARLGMRQEKF